MYFIIKNNHFFSVHLVMICGQTNVLL